MLASCAAAPSQKLHTAQSFNPPPHSFQSAADNAVKIGVSYQVAGQRYTPVDSTDYDQIGLASWYGEELRGQRTANGEVFDPDGISAAHPTLPLPSYVEVTSLDTGRTILVRVNDRGPFHSNRILDLSIGAARQLGITGNGARQIRVRRVYPSEFEKLALRNGQPVAERHEYSNSELAALRSRTAWRMPVMASVKLPAGRGPFYLQVASFSSKSRARSMAKHLNAKLSPLGELYRVRLGPYETAREANAALAPLAAKGYPDARIVQ
ncbi:septal ring lytic transglycosylase RlpA family protein [Sphingomonas paeninsulae]|uniref:Endolytic peptidoglycan transglycosylase RlpA n=1 Tax=Sphingomonas paeninsulae TaxID=2319844 RepID=A0A494TQQ5_SPHPE|nr:septal ring lytic transglycosylase RlpA family protein [Sphingomonas paeninsulae]